MLGLARSKGRELGGYYLSSIILQTVNRTVKAHLLLCRYTIGDTIVNYYVSYLAALHALH